ncbi:MAG: HAMP domain-containing histidine kinase [Lachnospiraceae bacterium]|nr:HAMP domain-containing histidine kinase [Lachnospiraceae bacterium]
MENKMKKKTGKTGRFMGWLVSIVLIAVFAWGFGSMYHRMTQEARLVYSDVIYYEKQEHLRDYVREIYPLVDGMYVEWYNKTYQDGKSAGEIILGEGDSEYIEKENHLNWYRLREETLSDWYKNTYPKALEESRVKYFIYSGTADNGCGTLDPMLAADYPMFIKFEFDEYGFPRPKEIKGIENANYHLLDCYSSRQTGNSWYDFSTGKTVEYGAIRGITVILACENEVYDELVREVSMSRWTIRDSVEAMWSDYIIFVMAAVAVVILLGLILPSIRPLGLKEGWKAHIPLELLVLVGCQIILLIGEELPDFIVRSQIEMEYPGLLVYWVGIMQDIMADGRAEYFIFAANVAIWFAVFLIIYLCAINVRQLFAKGFVRFFKENTLTGRIIVWLFKWVKKAIEFCGTIDFSNKGNRNFFLAVVLNFIVIALLCCIWFFGILLAIPYSLFVFWLLQKWWNKIRTDYTVMLSTTEEMAQGITDVEYVAEAGIFHELNTALAGVQEGFHTAVQEEVKSQKMKTELITNVSHDLKTPLTAIITYVDLLKNEDLSTEERKDYVDVLDRKSARLKTLIEDLFEISKATSGELKLEKVDLDLVQLIQEVQLELEEEIMKSGITFKMNLPEEKAVVHLDAQKTGRIFENLTMNILKHGLTGSRAYISMEQTEKTVQVVYKNVSATEINFSADEIMERFKRGDVSRNTEGSGLGLAIVKSFTEAQGGKVKVDLEDDMFKVTVSFPKVQAVRAEENEVVETAEEIAEAAVATE